MTISILVFFSEIRPRWCHPYNSLTAALVWLISSVGWLISSVGLLLLLSSRGHHLKRSQPASLGDIELLWILCVNQFWTNEEQLTRKGLLFCITGKLFSSELFEHCVFILFLARKAWSSLFNLVTLKYSIIIILNLDECGNFIPARNNQSFCRFYANDLDIYIIYGWWCSSLTNLHMSQV